MGSLDAEVPDPLQVSPVEYSAFRIDHYVNAHRSIGFFHSKIAQVVAVGARIESDGKSLKSAAVQYIKAAALLPPRRPGHIQLHLDCYGTVRTSAAALFAWYGDRDRSRSGRLSRIVRHGHIRPSDLFILHDIANASLAASEPVFGPPESHRTIQRSHVTKYLSKVRLLISRGKGTENSVLLPCPDEQVSEETHLTALKPALAPEGDGDLEDGELLGYEAAEGPESESRAFATREHAKLVKVFKAYREKAEKVEKAYEKAVLDNKFEL